MTAGIGNPFAARPERPPRFVLAVTVLVAAAWFGLAAASGAVWGSMGAMFMALLGGCGVFVAHERQSGGRWVAAALPLGALPAFTLVIGAFAAADGDVGFGVGALVVGLLLLAGSMALAAVVRRRYGDAPDTGGGDNFI